MDPDATDDLLYKAICQEDEAKIRTLLRDPLVEVNGSLQCVPYTPLHIACEVGNLKIVKIIKVSMLFVTLSAAVYASHARLLLYGLSDSTGLHIYQYIYQTTMNENISMRMSQICNLTMQLSIGLKNKSMKANRVSKSSQIIISISIFFGNGVQVFYRML